VGPLDGAHAGRVRVVPYLAPIAEAYAAADLALTRAGAMSIAELCAWALPALLVPCRRRRRIIRRATPRPSRAPAPPCTCRSGSCRPPRSDARVGELVADPARLRALAAASAARGRPDAAERIARRILEHLPLV
jgi:UDP-N-acetylglucosamine--N-acetylmuramyl-(pentapeptide) pyrophosphoryl-undecaprenol N-acetylglucosamine transferase